MSTVFAIFRMEAKRFLQSPTQVLTAFLMGPLVVFALLFVIGLASRIKAQIEIYGAEAIQPVLEKATENNSQLIFATGVPNTKRLKNESNLVLLLAEQDEVYIYYHSAMISDPTLLNNAKELATHIAALQLDEGRYPLFRSAISALKTKDLCTPEDYVRLGFIPFVSMVFVLAFMMTNMTLCQTALDIFPGERERGTFDMLRLSGTKLSLIIAGKYSVVVLLGISILTLSSFFLLLGLFLFQPAIFHFAAIRSERFAFLIPSIFLCLCSAAIFVSALYIALSASFPTVRQASAYTFGVQIILSLLSYSPNFANNIVQNYLPISNIWPVTQMVLTGTSSFGCVVISLIISTAVAFAAIYYASVVLEQGAKH